MTFWFVYSVYVGVLERVRVVDDAGLSMLAVESLWWTVYPY